MKLVETDARKGGMPANWVRQPRVVALHCSGSTGRQWRKLAERLGDTHRVHTPHLISAAGEPWHGAHPFSLAAEAAAILAVIDAEEGPVHLVGHSYGGGVALHLAARRPGRIASLSLYEPSAFHLLKQLGAAAEPALCEILGVADRVRASCLDGAYHKGAMHFVDYWNGPGSWFALKPELRTEMARYLPKAALDFNALFEELLTFADYEALPFPVLILRGEHAPAPSRLIAEALAARIRSARLQVVEGAGHMGPVTHGELVAEIIGWAVQGAEPGWAREVAA